jgi:hypothetical protein
MLRPLAIGVFALLSATAFCQRDLIGPGQFPAFRTLSGLPGGGYGVQPDGTPAFSGAMAFSTPIAYSLSRWHFALTGANTSDYSFFRLPHLTGSQSQDDSFGKISATGGVSLGRFGSLTGTAMLISSDRDSAFNFEYQAPLFYKNVGLAVGVQDLSGTRGDRAGNSPTSLDSRSLFAVMTVPLPYGIYTSVGMGDRRFGKGFANASAPLGDRFKAVLEFDGYNFNEALAYDPKALGSIKAFGRSVHATMMVGFVRSKYAFWSLNISE